MNLYKHFLTLTHEWSLVPFIYFQEALINKFGSNAHPFTMALMPLAPPSVQLVPAKEYNGAPIGTSYDVRVYIGKLKNKKENEDKKVRNNI